MLELIIELIIDCQKLPLCDRVVTSETTSLTSFNCLFAVCGPDCPSCPIEPSLAPDGRPAFMIDCIRGISVKLSASCR